MILEQNNCLILVIDIQEKLLNAVFNKENLKKNSTIMIKSANILEIPLFITEQYPQGLGETVCFLKDTAKNAQYYIKNDFNALNDSNLLEELKLSGKKQVLVLGIETHICVYQTILALLDNGFDVTVIKDSCGSRQEKEYLSALDCIRKPLARSTSAASITGVSSGVKP